MDNTDKDLVKKLEAAEARLNDIEMKLEVAECELKNKPHELITKRTEEVLKPHKWSLSISRKRFLLLVVIAGISIGVLYFFSILFPGQSGPINEIIYPLQTPPAYIPNSTSLNILANEVYPAGGFVLPVKWGDIVKGLINLGVLNETALIDAVLESNQTLTRYEAGIMSGTYNGYIHTNASDSEFVLLVLWSLGISNNNTIITKGPLSTYGNPDQYASTGGYLPLGKLEIGRLNLVNLTSEQQSEAVDVAAGTFRPCCDNPAMFPDCNHGAAELALIEMMASQGFNESQMFVVLQEFLSEYYPQNMFEVGVVYASHGINFSSVPANMAVGRTLFSASGSQNVGSYIQRYGLLQSDSGSSSSGSNSCST